MPAARLASSLTDNNTMIILYLHESAISHLVGNASSGLKLVVQFP
jgi:hypothetical protein